jgi:hypothetical protein
MSDMIFWFERPELTHFQLVPKFVDTNTPPPKVPTKRFESQIANSFIVKFVSPEFTDDQLEPLSVDKKTPWLYAVPANSLEPRTAKDCTASLVRPDCFQFFPKSVERKTPQSVAANKFCPFTASL